MPEVHYKFKSSLSFEVIKFTESSITVGTLKDLINQKQSIKTSGFDLKLKDSQGKIYTDDDEQVDIKSKIIVSRVPKIAKAQINTKKKEQIVSNKTITSNTTDTKEKSDETSVVNFSEAETCIITQTPMVTSAMELCSQSIPELLKCSLCRGLMKDATEIQCCRKSYCHGCITGHLFDPDVAGSLECPDCKAIVSNTDVNLTSNLRIRSMIIDFQCGRLDINSINVEKSIFEPNSSYVEDALYVPVPVLASVTADFVDNGNSMDGNDIGNVVETEMLCGLESCQEVEIPSTTTTVPVKLDDDDYIISDNRQTISSCQQVLDTVAPPITATSPSMGTVPISTSAVTTNQSNYLNESLISEKDQFDSTMKMILIDGEGDNNGVCMDQKSCDDINTESITISNPQFVQWEAKADESETKLISDQTQNGACYIDHGKPTEHRIRQDNNVINQNNFHDHQIPNRAEIPVIGKYQTPSTEIRYNTGIKESHNLSIHDMEFDPVMYMKFLKIVSENWPDELRKILSNTSNNNTNDYMHSSTKDKGRNSTLSQSTKRKKDNLGCGGGGEGDDYDDEIDNGYSEHTVHMSKKSRYDSEGAGDELNSKYKKSSSDKHNSEINNNSNNNNRYYDSADSGAGGGGSSKKSSRVRSRSKDQQQQQQQSHYQKKPSDNCYASAPSSHRRNRDYDVRGRGGDYYSSGSGPRYHRNVVVDSQNYPEERHNKYRSSYESSHRVKSSTNTSSATGTGGGSSSKYKRSLDR